MLRTTKERVVDRRRWSSGRSPRLTDGTRPRAVITRRLATHCNCEDKGRYRSDDERRGDAHRVEEEGTCELRPANRSIRAHWTRYTARHVMPFQTTMAGRLRYAVLGV